MFKSWRGDNVVKLQTISIHTACLAVRSGLNRLYPFTITVDGQTCASVTTGTSRSVDVTCSSIMDGQVVRVTRTNDTQMLNLCEFQVWGKYQHLHLTNPYFDMKRCVCRRTIFFAPWLEASLQNIYNAVISESIWVTDINIRSTDKHNRPRVSPLMFW